mgnify:CR=1 FL=1
MTELQLTLTPKESSEESELKKVISNKLKVNINQISHIQLVKKSIDSRSRQPLVLLKVRVFLGDEHPEYRYENTFHYGDVSKKPAVIIVGSGPAGLFAAFDIGTAKLSGRGLGHTGGTIDKFEAISGFHFPQTKEEMIEAINKTATGIMGASEKVVPLDKKLYALRDVTGTVMSIPLIASSIMSKKLAVYADGIILDVKVGSGAFMKNLDLARELAKSMLQIGESFDRKVVTVLTEMDQPLGYAVGNALEVVEAVETLKGRGPKDFTELCETLVAVALQIKGDVKTLEEGKEKVAEVLKSGKAVEKLKEFINYYGGNGNLVDDYTLLPQAKNVRVVLAKETGYVARIEAEEVGKAAMVLGAGRETKEDDINHAVGIILSKKIGDYVETGDVIATLYYDGDEKLESSLELLNGAYKYSPNKIEASPVVKEIHSVNI